MKISGLDDTIAWYDQNAEQYAEVNASIADIDQVDELAAMLSPGDTLLDAGCAAGRDSKLFAERGFEVTGIDISDGLLSIALRQSPEITFINMSFLNLTFKDQSFDAVWAHQSLLHLEQQKDVHKALSEFNRILKPGGILVVLVKAQMGPNKTAVVSDKFSGHDRFFQYFTRDEIRSLLKDSDFDILKLEEYMETDKNPQGRSEVGLLYAISKKVMPKI